MTATPDIRPRHRLRTAAIVLGVTAVTVVVLGAIGTGDALRVASALTAHELCSTTFVAGRDPDAVFDEYVQPFVGVPILRSVVRYRVDRAAKAVTASVAGLFGATAVYDDERGCTVEHRDEHGQSLMRVEGHVARTGWTPPPGIVLTPAAGPTDPGLAAAVERAFAEPAEGKHLGRKAMVVVADGTIVAEKYAPGYDATTRLQSWSMAKSLTHALIGVLVRQGRLSLFGPAPVAAWRDPGDPRHAVTIDQLLRQTSGQPFGQSNTGFDPSTHMQFLERDTAAVAAAARFDAPPGQRWSYTDGNFAILSGLIVRFADSHNIRWWIQRELFEPVGMTSALIEFDEVGTPMGADWAFATARDWARFGLLYARDGMVGDQQILPASWAAYAASPTVAADVGYGAGFFTNVGPSRGAVHRRALGAPPDSFFALGTSGQVVFIVPSHRLVVVSLGFSLEASNRAPVAGAIAVVQAAIAAGH